MRNVPLLTVLLVLGSVVSLVAAAKEGNRTFVKASAISAGAAVVLALIILITGTLDPMFFVPALILMLISSVITFFEVLRTRRSKEHE